MDVQHRLMHEKSIGVFAFRRLRDQHFALRGFMQGIFLMGKAKALRKNLFDGLVFSIQYSNLSITFGTPHRTPE